MRGFVSSGVPKARLPAIATLLFAIEMLVVLLLTLTLYLFASQVTAEQQTINTALTAGLEQAAVIPTTQNGAYYDVGWNGQGVTLQSSALPAALSQTLQRTVPGSTTDLAANQVSWSLPGPAATVWHVTGPITIGQLQATDGPNQPVTLNGQTHTYPYPVIAGVVQVPLTWISFFSWHWTTTMTEAFILPLAGRESPQTLVPFQNP